MSGDGRGDRRGNGTEERTNEFPPGPSVPAEALSGWSRVERSTDRLLSLGPVRVTATTVVYEAALTLRRSPTGDDCPDLSRFFFASRLAVEPHPGDAGRTALSRLVADRARRGFVDRLRERGLEAVERAGSRTLHAGDVDAADRFEARYRVDGVVSVTGWLLVRPAGEYFIVTGGAYPTAVVEPSDGTAPLGDALDPDACRRDLLGLMRAVE